MLDNKLNYRSQISMVENKIAKLNYTTFFHLQLFYNFISHLFILTFYLFGLQSPLEYGNYKFRPNSIYFTKLL